MSRFGQSDAEGEHEESEANANAHVHGFEPYAGFVHSLHQAALLSH